MLRAERERENHLYQTENTKQSMPLQIDHEHFPKAQKVLRSIEIAFSLSTQ